MEVRSPAVDYWVEFRVSLYAASRMFLTPWRRWFCEVSARRTDWPYPSESFWTHYCTYDFYATSLRSAFLRAARQAEKLWDDMLADPDLRPEPAEKLMAPWVPDTPAPPVLDAASPSCPRFRLLACPGSWSECFGVPGSFVTAGLPAPLRFLASCLPAGSTRGCWVLRRSRADGRWRLPGRRRRRGAAAGSATPIRCPSRWL